MFRQMIMSMVKLLLQRGLVLCKPVLRQYENPPQVAQAVKSLEDEFNLKKDHICAFWDTHLCMQHILTRLAQSHARLPLTN